MNPSRLLRALGAGWVSLGLVAAAAGGSDGADAPRGPAAVVKVSQKPAAKKKRTRKPATKATPAPEPDPAGGTAAKPAADTGLKFSRDVAPIIVANCLGCHNPQQKRGKLDLSTFDGLLAGTPDEKVIVPGKPEESHLVLRIKGEETPKMPQGANRNLSDDAISRIERWVKAGATLDAGLDRSAPLSKYAATPDDLRKQELAKMSPQERDRKVEAAGRERWKKADPKTESTITVTPSAHFLLFGTLPKERAASALKAVEAEHSMLRNLLGAPSLEWGEKASLYVFNDAGTFQEFARLVENREVDTKEVGSARFNVAEPYVAVVDPLGGRDEPPAGRKPVVRGRRDDDGPERTLAGLLVEQVAVGAVGRAGKAPRWLTLGLAAQLATRAEPRPAYAGRLRRAAADLYQQGWTSHANDALGDATKADDVRAVGFALVEWLGTTGRSTLPEFTRGMLDGQEKLDDVIKAVLNGSREQFLQASGAFVGSQYGRGR